MKKYLIIPFVLFCFNINAQNKPLVTELKGKSLITLLCSVDTVLFKSNDVISVILYKVSNGSGSANSPGTDEVSNKFLIAVSSIDEVPDQRLFSIGDFYNPKMTKFYNLKTKDCALEIEYGIYKHRKRISLNISLNKVSVISNK